MVNESAPGHVTLVEVLADLAAVGFETDFFVDEDTGTLGCRVCRAVQLPDQVRAESIRRLEGASDPGDMAVVLGVRCPDCGAKGTAVLRYGPEATAGEALLLRRLDDVRPDGLDAGEQAAMGDAPEPGQTSR